MLATSDSPTEYPLVFTVVLTWNHKELTADCLQSVLATHYSEHKVVVVDNGSEDGTADYVRREFPGVMIIQNERNLGYAAGCNIGLRYALEQNAKYVLLLNNDTLVQPDLMDLLVSWAERNPADAILTPLIRYAGKPDRAWFAGSRRHPITLDTRDFGPGRTERVAIAQSREIDYVVGCAMFVRTDALRQVGLFDESFFMYGEDLDLSIRVQAAGFKLRFVPGSTVWHRVEASTGASHPLRYYYKARGSIRFYRKHVHGVNWLIIIPYRIASALKTLVRLLVRARKKEARAHLCGLRDGIRGRYGGEYVG